MSKDLSFKSPQFEKVLELLASGNLDQFTPKEKVEYVTRLCEASGLNPLSRPFEFIRFQGKTVLYASKGCADQLRKINHISIKITEKKIEEGVLFITVEGSDREGRIDTDMGALPVASLKGEALANGVMKCLTKAKRRLSLSMCGLGIMDESEFDTLPEKDIEEGLKEVDRRDAAHERLEEKAIQAENMGEIQSIIDLIHTRMGILTEGETIAKKGKAMVELLGVNRFEDLKTKSLDELKAKNKNLGQLVEEKKLRVKPSFKLES